MSTETLDVLVEKWQPVLENENVEGIADSYKKKVTARMLENTEKFLGEAGEPTNVSGSNDYWDPVLISLVRRMAPKLIAYDVTGVQPMSGPTGLIFALRARYADNADLRLATEAQFNEADTSFSGTGTHAETDPFDPGYATGVGMDTATAEGDAWNEMGMTIEKTSVEAKSRQLRADYSIELAQDLRAIHGLDAENELANILSTEIISEINREVVRMIYHIAVFGAQDASTPGQFDLDVDADGRWSVEKFKGLIFQIERDANAIARSTRRGKGNVIICSADVASALAMAGVLDYAPALGQGTNLDVDVTGTTYAGMFKGKFKVFVDPYATGEFYTVGYRGANQYDAGFFYCPYVPLQMVRATDQTTFQPAIGFKTRYGLVSNPFVSNGLASNSNFYYRKVKVLNLL